MENNNIFKLIHTVELFTNETIIKWNQTFKYNIGVAPIITLAELKQNGPQQQTVLAKRLGYTPGAMTNIAARLIKQGMAERQYNENDRRHVLLAITEKGLDVLKEAQKKGQEMRVELFQELTEEEVEQFLTIHEKLLNKLKSRD
ncbi:MarR family winged helix-turn-helix transcriptional regulator [Neobacillus kokaensis]|uniref:HTH marR-type domain-containing protein n=1 Tax=Neobacillus kokaensis TaxID=2759023 RepID=A0ABQ3N4M6_9BACI|nr:MarR family transcriptional regulator [Neobacillus kokaensis]GHH99016.1 hypothetical protein AM1BK_25590 [Neobacillus kokaensis]